MLHVFRRSRAAMKMAQVVSRVFDPILLVPGMFVVAVTWALNNGERWRFLTMLVFWDAMLPGVVLYWWIRRGKVLSGWDLKDRKERIPLFMFVIAAHLGGVVGAYMLDKHPLAEFLLVFWLLALVYGVVTVWWKISIHTGVMSALVMFLVLTQGKEYAWLFALVLLVVWARVVGRYHRLSQAVAGGMVPVVVMPVVFRILGIG